MGYLLNDTQKNIKDMVAEFAKREVLPLAKELDEEARYPKDIIDKITR